MEPQDEGEFAVLVSRARAEEEAPDSREQLIALARSTGPQARDALAEVLAQPGRSLWECEMAAFTLGCAGDRRAFESLVLLLNHRDSGRGATAAHALARLGDPRTARAAAALASNELRTAYALHPVRLLVALRAPESVPTLVALLARLLRRPDQHRPVLLACVEGLGALGDQRARSVLAAAADHQRLRPAASAALARAGG